MKTKLQNILFWINWLWAQLTMSAHSAYSSLALPSDTYYKKCFSLDHILNKMANQSTGYFHFLVLKTQ